MRTYNHLGALQLVSLFVYIWSVFNILWFSSFLTVQHNRIVYDVLSTNNGVTSEKKKHFLAISTFEGRLGNHLFFYASGRGMAKEIGCIPLVSRDDPIFKIFKINANYSLQPLHLDNNRYILERGMAKFSDPKIITESRNFNLTAVGYFQSWKYFKHIDDEIRREFTLKDDIRQKVEAIFHKSNVSERTKVGVHVRRGDFLELRRKGYTVPDAIYFHKAMNIFRQTLDNPTFVVCSDDVNWVMENLMNEDVLLVHESLEVDFGVLMSSDHSIISVGTFGWWTAYLANGKTIYYKDFPRYTLLTQYNLPDYYPPQWIGLK